MHHIRLRESRDTHQRYLCTGIVFGIAGSWVRLNFRYNLDIVSCRINMHVYFHHTLIWQYITVNETPRYMIFKWSFFLSHPHIYCDSMLIWQIRAFYVTYNLSSFQFLNDRKLVFRKSQIQKSVCTRVIFHELLIIVKKESDIKGPIFSFSG